MSIIRGFVHTTRYTNMYLVQGRNLCLKNRTTCYINSEKCKKIESLNISISNSDKIIKLDKFSVIYNHNFIQLKHVIIKSYLIRKKERFLKSNWDMDSLHIDANIKLWLH